MIGLRSAQRSAHEPLFDALYWVSLKVAVMPLRHALAMALVASITCGVSQLGVEAMRPTPLAAIRLPSAEADGNEHPGLAFKALRRLLTCFSTIACPLSGPANPTNAQPINPAAAKPVNPDELKGQGVFVAKLRIAEGRFISCCDSHIVKPRLPPGLHV